jgi:anti-sigma factor RsiW
VQLRQRIEAHITECPNCFVILDTTKRTIQVYKGMQPQTLPEEVHARLLRAVERKLSGRKPGVA